MTNFSIQAFTGSIQNQPTQLVHARELHQFLQVGRDFSNWIKSRITDYDFQEDEDFICSPNLASEKRGGQNRIEYAITLDMAKELCMLERSELGKQARRYFIRIEKEALSARQELLSQQDVITIPKDEYIELIKFKMNTLEGKQPLGNGKYTKKLTPDEKQTIGLMYQQGYSITLIAKHIQRSDSAVRSELNKQFGE